MGRAVVAVGDPLGRFDVHMRGEPVVTEGSIIEGLATVGPVLVLTLIMLAMLHRQNRP